jgi:hypothetical protein
MINIKRGYGKEKREGGEERRGREELYCTVRQNHPDYRLLK